MTPNQLMSESLSVLGTIDAASAAAGTYTSGWVPAKNHSLFLAIIATGVLGAGATVDAKLQQATSAAGAGAKDIANKAITQVVKATGDNKQVLINLKEQELDVEGGFAFIRISVTVAVTASIVGATLVGAEPRFAPAQGFNQAAVAQIVN